ncbi:MAG: N-acetylmuramoyl-L-alanine amidase [Oscillospiraceae bacterium]
MKRILSFFLTLVLTAALLCPAALAANETAGKDSDWLYITLDPGHGGDGAGGNDSGAINESTYGYQEADLVLKIGLYLKEELETYRNVHVDMTRSDSYGTSATAP